MIRLGELVDAKREIPFPVMSDVDPLVPAAPFTWTLGMVQVQVPGQAPVDVALSRIQAKANGTWVVVLNDAQAAAGAGKVYVYAGYAVAMPGAQSVTVYETIEDPADSASGGPVAGVLLPAGPVTLDGLLDIVRTRGDYLSSLTFTPAYIKHEIQAAWNELYEIIEELNEGWWDKDSTVATVAGQAFIALPTDCWRVKGVDIDTGGTWQKIDQVPTAARNRRTGMSGRPDSYRLTMRGLELFPVPSTAYSLRITYAPICPALQDSVGIQLYGWQEYVITGALLRLDQREERPLQERQIELERCKQRVIKAASRRRQAEPELLTLHEGGFDSTFEEWY